MSVRGALAGISAGAILATMTPSQRSILAQALQAKESQSVSEACKTDLLLFGRTYVPHWFADPWPSFAQEVASALLGEEDLLVRWWRGGGKSKITVELDTLHALLYGRTQGDLILSGTGPTACKRLLNVRDELERNPKIRRDFGDQIGEPWNEDLIRLRSGATLEAKGSREQIRGDRPQRIKFDDSERDDRADSDVHTASARERYREWVERQVVPALQTGGRLFAVFTPIHSRSYWELISQGQHRSWRLLTYSLHGADGRSRWPEKFTPDVVAKIKEKISTDAYLQEYELVTRAETGALIRPEWIRWYGAQGDAFPDRPEGTRFYKVLTVDSAISKRDSADHTAMAISLRAQDGPAKGSIFFAEVWRGHWTMMRQVEEMWKAYNAYRPDLIFLPESLLEKVLAELLPHYFAQQGCPHPPIRTYREDVDKRRKAMRVVNLFEKGQVYFHRKFAGDAVNELLAFTGCDDDADDQVDAIVSNLLAQQQVLFPQEEEEFDDDDEPQGQYMSPAGNAAGGYMS